MLEHRKNYESKLEAQLAQWSADLDVLKAKARRAEVGARVQSDQTLDDLQRKYDEAGEHLKNLKAAGDEAWEALKDSTEKGWNEVKAIFNAPAAKH